MQSRYYPKIAFIGWNPFQLIQVLSLMNSMPNAVFILENKHNSASQFDENLLACTDVPVVITRSRDIHKIDELYDIIVCQTTFTDIHKFQNAKIAMIQYGYAKEAHNYGPWRSLADICFTYGAYATNKMNYFCPTCEVGFIRQVSVVDPQFLSIAERKYSHLIDPDKKTLLYLPTWGEYCSENQYLDIIIALRKKYNVLVKTHHNTDLLGLKKTSAKHNLKRLGANDDALQLIILSDIVISDYSGAIFDAIYCKKPVVLLDSKEDFSKNGKVDQFSLECCDRDKLGYIVKSPEKLEIQINKALKEKKSKVSTAFHNDLFSKNKRPHKLVHETLVKLVEDKNSYLSQQQLYIRSAMRELYSAKYSSIRYKFLNLLQETYSKLIRINKLWRKT